MKIAIVGYGKMGQIIEKKALQRGHSMGPKITSANQDLLSSSNFKGVDLAIEFTGPQAAKKNITKLLEMSIPVVSGSTGWLDDLTEILELNKKTKGAFFYASNFSISVNVFFAINKKLASLINSGGNYQNTIEEIHHIQKKDSPSGTAISLANQIIESNPSYTEWKEDDKTKEGMISIVSKREIGVPGTHSVCYNSVNDSIEIKHTAHSRDSFALGAVMAAEWLLGRKGYFTMENMLNL